jgi:hypothetical protein
MLVEEGLEFIGEIKLVVLGFFFRDFGLISLWALSAWRDYGIMRQLFYAFNRILKECQVIFQGKIFFTHNDIPTTL